NTEPFGTTMRREPSVAMRAGGGAIGPGVDDAGGCGFAGVACGCGLPGRANALRPASAAPAASVDVKSFLRVTDMGLLGSWLGSQCDGACGTLTWPVGGGAL